MSAEHDFARLADREVESRDDMEGSSMPDSSPSAQRVAPVDAGAVSGRADNSGDENGGFVSRQSGATPALRSTLADEEASHDL